MTNNPPLFNEMLNSLQNSSRRNMLKQSGVGFGYLAAAALLGELSSKAVSAETAFERALAAKPSHFPCKAKRAIFLFMKGGPSHIDTFDYKPQLQKDDGKELPFDKPRVQFAKTGKLLGVAVEIRTVWTVGKLRESTFSQRG
jgi:hypothetical protein